MLLRCLELRNPIQRFIRKLRTQNHNSDFDDDATDDGQSMYNPITDSLSDDEWNEVADLVDFLETPYEMSRRLEGSNSASGFGSLWQNLPNLQTLWARYRAASDSSTHADQYLNNAVSYGLEKLNTYFERLILEPTPSFYAVATALHPRLRLAWFKTHWKDYPIWYSKAERSVRSIFKQYIDLEAERDIDDPPLQPLRRKQPTGRSDFHDETMSVDLMLLIGSRSHKRQKRTFQLDEYFDDLREDLTNPSITYDQLLQDPWLWWLEVVRTKCPIVFKMACDYLSIPSTSCDCERAFSCARRTITCDRNALNGATIEALQLQKNWLQRRIVESDLSQLQTHIEKLESSVRSLASNSQSTPESS